MKYKDTHPYEEIKALCISSMYRVKARIARNNVLVTENIPEIRVEASPETNKISQLIETLSKAISEDQMVLVEAIINPPEWVYSKISNEDVRIPSRLFLEYFDIEPSPSQVKRLNRFRRRLEFFVRNFIDPYSLKFNKKFLSLIKQRD